MIWAPVGKSGPCKTCLISSILTSGLLATNLIASTNSLKLWGGILVAIPTAIPFVPLANKLGNKEGKTTGSDSLPS